MEPIKTATDLVWMTKLLHKRIEDLALDVHKEQERIDDIIHLLELLVVEIGGKNGLPKKTGKR